MNPTKPKNRYRRKYSGPSQRRNFSKSKSQRGKFRSGHARQHRKTTGGSNKGQRGKQKMSAFNPSQFINANPVDVVSEEYKPKHNFSNFGLNSKLLQAIVSLGFNSPSPIQDQIIPEILKGKDVIGLAETGTGKTAAFLIPLIQKTLKERNRQTLILTPTRELALQIEEDLQKLSRGNDIYSTTCIGGMNIRPQIKSLHRTNHFIVGTPGRIIDLIKRGHFVPAKITTAVLDEADRMLDMGFIPDMRAILSKTPKNRETLFFSAVMSKDTQRLVHDFLHNPVTISVKKKDVTNSIVQDVVRFKHNEKFDKLLELLSNPKFKRVLVFGSMKHSVEKLSQELLEYGIKAASIHGNKRHTQRQRALKRFKNGDVHVLVATDVAARGIHVDNVTHVINYDLPNTFEDYVNRIGRTGRATKHGEALTFVPL